MKTLYESQADRYDEKIEKLMFEFALKAVDYALNKDGIALDLLAHEYASKVSDLVLERNVE